MLCKLLWAIETRTLESRLVHVYTFLYEYFVLPLKQLLTVLDTLLILFYFLFIFHKNTRARSVLFLNLHFLRTKKRMKMVFWSCCIFNLSMHLVSFCVSYILKTKIIAYSLDKVKNDKIMDKLTVSLHAN